MKKLQEEFDAEMMRIYLRARDEADYNATRFLSMLVEHHGLDTARILLHTKNVSDVYCTLAKRPS